MSQQNPIRIGTAGWSIPRLSAVAFPGAGSHLHRYARILPCAEINATFYRSPRTSTFTRWAASVPPHFRFSVKAPRAITHEAALACTPPQLRAFLDEAAHLGAALGPILFQLPPKLVFDPHRAATFFTMLRNLFAGPAVLEPRHPSWFTAEADALLKQLHIARAAADPALAPSAFTPAGTRSLVYLRLHGSPRTYYSSYTGPWLRELATVLLDHHASGSDIWCIFDNTASGAAAANALDLQHLVAHHDTQTSSVCPTSRL